MEATERVLGFFERRAVVVAGRRARTEYSEDELIPIRVLEKSCGWLRTASVLQLEKALDDHTVIFLHRGGQGGGSVSKHMVGMLSPINFEYLLQVRDVLCDHRLFQVVDHDSVAQELGIRAHAAGEGAE